MNTKTTPGPVFVTKFRERSVAMLREKCFTYEDTLSTIKSTFSLLKDVPDEEIVLLSILPGYNYHGFIEIPADTWKELGGSVCYLLVVLKAERVPLENKIRVNSAEPPTPDN